MADDWNSLQSTFGLTAQDIASLKTQGMNPNSATDFLTKGIGSNTLMQGPGGMSLSQLINLRSAFGGGGGVAQAPAKPANPGGVDPNQPEVNLGAAALGQRAVYNPTPSAGIDPVSGVSTSANTPTTSDIIPKVPKGPWTQVPSVFNPTTAVQPTAPLPVAPTRQATGVPFTPGQSWATPPPAPGLTFGGGAVPMPMGGGGQQGVPQNWQGAGQVAPSGIPSGGGVAGSAIALGTTGAQPAPYTGTVHNDPFMSNAVSKLMGLASNPWHPEGSSATTASPAKPIKMSSGGYVPGDPNDNTDSVPAWLKPGEYVIPKGQAREIPRGLLGGGITPATQSAYYSPPPAPSNQQSGQQSTQSRAASTHTDVGAGSETIANLGKLYANRANQGGLGGKAGAVYDANGNLVTSSGDLTAQAAAGSGATMMPGGGIRDPSGLVYDSSANLAAQDVGGAGATMPGAGGGAGAGQMGSAVAGGIGAIGGAIQKMFDPSNIGSWKMQTSAIPAAPSSNRYAPSYDLRTPIV